MFKVMLIVVSFTITGEDIKITENRDIQMYSSLETCEIAAEQRNLKIPEEVPTIYLCELR